MAKARDKNVVSLWFWLLSVIVMMVPLVNVVWTLIWAFVGENQTRKNYFRALIVFFLLLAALLAFLIGIGFVPHLIDRLIDKYEGLRR